ncbi:hypothetical protein G9A89_022735 [Geosiphon pyriformis]|nr:hypothetical protein G9A89_022735 [Geosiphon pyriformis]
MELASFNYKDKSAIQLKYFDNNGKEIKPEKAHEIDAEYDLKYLGKDTLILPRAIVQIASQSLLISKEINVREGVIDARYTGDITIIIEHAKKIVQAIYLLLINISGLQLINNREQLGKNKKGTQGFGSTKRFTIPVNIAFNTQNESHQILQLLQPITISLFKKFTLA